MSDELIEGRALRERRPGDPLPEREIRPPGREAAVAKAAKPVEPEIPIVGIEAEADSDGSAAPSVAEPSKTRPDAAEFAIPPFATLVPPSEAGDVFAEAGAKPTRPSGLQPVGEEISLDDLSWAMIEEAVVEVPEGVAIPDEGPEAVAEEEIEAPVAEAPEPEEIEIPDEGPETVVEEEIEAPVAEAPEPEKIEIPDEGAEAVIEEIEVEAPVAETPEPEEIEIPDEGPEAVVEEEVEAPAAEALEPEEAEMLASMPEPPSQPIMRLPAIKPEKEGEDIRAEAELDKGLQPLVPTDIAGEPEEEAAVAPAAAPAATPEAAGFETPAGVLPRIVEEETPEPGVDDFALGATPPYAFEPVPLGVMDEEDSSEYEAVADEALSDEAISDEAEEVVEAEWVVEVDGRLQELERPLQPEEYPYPEFDEAIPVDTRKGTLRMLIIPVLITVLLAGLVIVRLLVLGSSPDEGDGTPIPIATAPSAGGASVAGPSPTANPTATLPVPYAQGRIAFSSNRDGRFQIYVLDMVTETLSRVTESGASDRSPVWSPDGSQIVFVSDRTGDANLFVMNSDGTGVIQITSDPAMDRTPAWSPNGRTIVFSRETREGSSLYALDTACFAAPGSCESGLTPLTPVRNDLYPAWSPNGGLIAFASSILPGMPTSITLVDADGQSQQTLPGTGSSDFNPVWSPDGLRLAFVSFALDNRDLWIMSAIGGNVIQLTGDPADDVEPDWSPDGAFIAFASDRGEQEDFELYLIRTNCAHPGESCEANLIQLTDNEADDLEAAWTGTLGP